MSEEIKSIREQAEAIEQDCERCAIRSELVSAKWDLRNLVLGLSSAVAAAVGGGGPPKQKKKKKRKKKNKNRLLAKNSKKKSNKTDQTHKKIKNNEEHPRNRNETHQHGTQHRPYLAKQNKKAHTC
jgi:hypothetical protein